MTTVFRPTQRTQYTQGAYQFTSAAPSFQPSSDQDRFTRASIDTPEATWVALIDELLGLRNLQNDWDGVGAVAPPPSLVDYAIRLAQDFKANDTPPADRVVASVNGTIYFEWHSPQIYQEVEVLSPTDAECRVVRSNTGVTEVFKLNRR